MKLTDEQISEIRKEFRTIRNGSRYYDSHGSPPCGACDGTGYEEGE